VYIEREKKEKTMQPEGKVGERGRGSEGVFPLNSGSRGVLSRKLQGFIKLQSWGGEGTDERGWEGQCSCSVSDSSQGSILENMSLSVHIRLIDC
jgi:hypothetical protein